MKKIEFNYYLPEELIAQTPIQRRDHSRMMVLDKKSGNIEHKNFYNIVDEIMPGDCMVLNDSRVLPARLYGVKKNTGAKVEFLLLNTKSKDIWEVIAGPGKRVKVGDRFIFEDGILECEIVNITEEGNRIVKFFYDENFYSVLDKIGQMPLPHYIKKRLENDERYQTVYSRELGSVAAPTAGLHFTEDLLNKLKDKGVKVAYVTLHVGLGTFRPVKTDIITNHKMHAEHYEISEPTANLINETSENGGKIFSVGTTSCRTLESVVKKEGKIQASEGWTDIFIYPGYEFKVIDGLITNFHLPESTLIMLVSAFAGHENTMRAYDVAVKERYRFFSFGDSMIIH